MKKYILFILLSLSVLTSSAQIEKIIPEVDKELLSNISHLMRLPEGIHKIYNGTGNTVFDIRYTIDISKDKWILYKGGTKSPFDILYSVEYQNKEYKIYKGNSNSVFNIIYSIKETKNGFEIYKGNSTSPFNLLYSYEQRN